MFHDPARLRLKPGSGVLYQVVAPSHFPPLESLPPDPRLIVWRFTALSFNSRLEHAFRICHLLSKGYSKRHTSQQRPSEFLSRITALRKHSERCE